MPREFRYSRPKKDPEELLVDFLSKKFSYFSLEEWKRHVQNDLVQVNHVVSRDCDYILQQGDVILYTSPENLEPDVDDVNVHILYEDDAILVCGKNGNLPVAEGGRYCLHTLSALLNDDASRSRFYSEKTVLRSSEVMANESDRSKEANLSLKRRRSGDDDTHVSANLLAHAAVSRQKLVKPIKYRSVHRLDKETSGVVVFAKSLAVAQQLTTQFEAHSADTTATGSESDDVCLTSGIMWTTSSQVPLRKRYVALLHGAAPVGATFSVVNRLGTYAEDWDPAHPDAPQHEKLKKLKMRVYPNDHDDAAGPCASAAAVVPKGKHARTDVHIVAASTLLNASVAVVELFTGRSHQIRVHCAHVGFPVLGDKLYATTSPGVSGGEYAVPDDEYIQRCRSNCSFEPVVSVGASGADGPPQLAVRRHLLHATSLNFVHPLSAGSCHQTTVEFVECPGPYFSADIRSLTPEAEPELQRLFKTLYF